MVMERVELLEELALSYNELLQHYDKYADGRIPPTSLIVKIRKLRDELGLNEKVDDSHSCVEGQGVSDQYVYSCCAAQHHDKPCVLFGVRVDADGKKWAIIGFTQEVPVDEVATWSRRKAEKAARATASGAPPASGYSGG